MSKKAVDRHAQALAITRDISAPLEEARALEGLGQAHLQDANPGQAATHLWHALAIYQRIGAPAARRVQQTPPHPQPGLHHPRALVSGTPNSEGHQPASARLTSTKPLTGSGLDTHAQPSVRQNRLICTGTAPQAPSHC